MSNNEAALRLVAGLNHHSKNLSSLVLHAAQEGREVTPEELQSALTEAATTIQDSQLEQRPIESPSPSSGGMSAAASAESVGDPPIELTP